jgi:hypothetical protein
MKANSSELWGKEGTTTSAEVTGLVGEVESGAGMILGTGM